jgi:putative PEP-CTERM system TPR-repeat lipoprotein
MNFLKSIVCASIVVVLSACSENESAQSHISKAKSLIVEDQNNAAVISLKNALKMDAENGQARFLLGRLYLDEGDAERAEKELERANQLKFDAEKVIPLLARAYLLAESDLDILALAAQAESLPVVNTQYLAYKTMAYLRTENMTLAEDTVALALSVSEGDSYSMLASAYLAFSKQNITYANTLAARILTAAPKNADALMLQGQIAIVEKNYPLAVESFQKYSKEQPKSGKVQLFIADALLKNGQHKEAEKIADGILAKIPRQPFLQYIKAMSRFEHKDYKEASNYASQSLNSGFSSFSLKLVAGASAFYLKNYEQSNHHLKDLMPNLPAEHPARKMLAVSQLKLGFIDDINETLIGYDAKNKENAQFLSTLSYELLEVGAYEKAQEMAESAAKSSNMTAEQTARAGVLKLMMNDPSGVENLELALQQNPELISAELALAFASIKSGDLPRASEIADKWLKKYPDQASAYNLQATIYFQQNELALGKAALETSLRLEPNNVYALIQMVKLANHQKNTKQAILLTEQGLKSHPTNREILRLYFNFHTNEEGLKVITDAQQANANNIDYGILLAEALMRLDKFKQASSVLDSYQVNVKTPKRYWKLALAANAKQADGKDKFTILDKWHKTNSYHIEPTLLLANYWVMNKSPDRALSVIENAFNNHPQNLMLHLVKMEVLLKDRRANDAKDFFPVLAQFDINQNIVAGIEGRILLLERNFAAAIPKLKKHYQAKPGDNNAIYLSLALEGNSQQADAIELLEKHVGKNKANPRVSLSLANLYLSKNQDKAITEYEQLIKRMPNNVLALNNLSWLYMDQGKLVQALEYSTNAYALAAKIPNVVDTYAQALLKSDKITEALAKAEEAYKLSQGKDIDIALNFAEALLANKKDEDAKQLLNNITAVTKKQIEKKVLLLK